MKEKLYCIFLFLAVLLSFSAYCLTIAWASKTGKSYIGMPSWNNNGIMIPIKKAILSIIRILFQLLSVFAWHPVLMICGFLFCQGINNHVIHST